MYNNITELKIKDIPSIGDIDIERLPQELTRIYAQIVSLRRKVLDGTINFQDDLLVSSLILLRTLANNLETLLLINPQHEQKESIAFVAATANSLIHKMGLISDFEENLLEIDSISSYIASSILFLIGNSQADAAEMAYSTNEFQTENLVQQRLISCINSLAKGRLSDIFSVNFSEDEMFVEGDPLETAMNYLWRELGLGIANIATKLAGKDLESEKKHFDTVINLSASEEILFEQKNIFSGPYRLAKLLKMLEMVIYENAVINIPAPNNINENSWHTFLEKLAENRPFLWENHKTILSTNFLSQGQSAILTLPTGAGKSTLSELKIASCLYSKQKVIFLVPTHALEDQVNRNLKLLFNEFDPINIELGGEYSEFLDNDNFPILVMTPERCLTFLNINPNYLQQIGLIVFDEFHLIHGKDLKRDRRSFDAMYCLLSLFTLRPEADYLLISAMVENGQEISDWISQITGRECSVYNSSWKPTRQLHGCIVYNEDKISELNANIEIFKKSKKTKNPNSALKKIMITEPFCFFSLKNVWETKQNNDYFLTEIGEQSVQLAVGNDWKLKSNRYQIAADLAIHYSRLGLKTLVFVDSPRYTNSVSTRIENSLSKQVNNYDEFVIINKDLINTLKQELGDIKHSYFNYCQNVGVHHGFLLPIERNLIENYFKFENGLTVLVATATLAQGINLPAEIVIIAGDDRFDENSNYREPVQPYELLNAAGRAGRAGLSSQGAVILIPGAIITIKDKTISRRWWKLKNDVFSKGDQCLQIEDPLAYFLDSLQEDLQSLSLDQTNILYRFKPEQITDSTDTATRNLLSKSFYAYQAKKNGNIETFDSQVKRLLDRRSELDDLSQEEFWLKDISIKTGIDPNIINKLNSALGDEDIEEFLSKTIPEIIDWFISWLSLDISHIEKIFTKSITIDQIKKTVGLKPSNDTPDLLPKLSILSLTLQKYVEGMPLNEINQIIVDAGTADNTPYLMNSRNFIRLVPELSFAFGILSMILIERSQLLSINEIPWDIKILASCIREGFDSSEVLFFKNRENLMMRVQTHIAYNNSI